jgi:hypothetical protein
MDALTNVVAVLILVLILLQVDVGKTVEKLLGNLPPATQQQIDDAKAKLADLSRDRDNVRKSISAKPPDPALIEQAKRDIALLDASNKESQVRLLDIAKLKELLAKHQKTYDAEKQKTQLILDEIRKLEALLDQTPIPTPPKADVVRIPNSRDIPEGATMYYAYVLNNRLHLIDPTTAKKMVLAEFDKVRSKFLRETINVKGGRDRKIYDQSKLVAHFATLDLKVRDQKITLPENPTGTRPVMRIEFDRQNGGIPLSELEQPNSEWHRMCKLIRSQFRAVLMFRVRGDGFAAYIKAREIADAANIPCGWELSDSMSHTEILPDFEFNRLREPPKSQPKRPDGPPPPKRTLD